MTQSVQRTAETSEATTSTNRGPGTPAPTTQMMRGALRGASYADGAKMLAPRDGGSVQMKGGPEANVPGGPAAPAQEPNNAQQEAPGGGGGAGGPGGPAAPGGGAGGPAGGAPGGGAQNDQQQGRAEQERGQQQAREQEARDRSAAPPPVQIAPPEGDVAQGNQAGGPAPGGQQAGAGAQEAGPQQAAPQDAAPPGGQGPAAGGQGPGGAQDAAPGGAAAQEAGPAAPGAGNQQGGGGAAPPGAAPQVAAPGGLNLGAGAGGGPAPAGQGQAEAPVQTPGAEAGPAAGNSDVADAPEVAPAAGGPAAAPVAAPEQAPGGGAGFAPPDLGPAAIATPDSLPNQNVEQVIGPDPATGNTFFWGTATPDQAPQDGAQAAPSSKQIPQSGVDAIGQQQADAANQLLTTFLSEGDARVEAMKAEREATIATVQAAIVAERARITSAAAAARQSTAAKAAAARQQIAANAANARTAVSTGLTETIATIDAGLAAARATVEAKFASANGDVATIRSGFTQGVNDAFTSGVAAITAVGTDFAGRARTQASTRAGTYQAAALPQTSRWDRFVDGANYEANKRTARVNAANQVGAGYAEEFTKKAGEVAQGLQGGAQQVITGAGQTFTQAEQAVASNKTTALDQLESGAAQARQGAQTFADQRLAAIASEETQMTQTVDSGAQQAQQQVDAAERSGVANVDSIGNTAVTMLGSGYDTTVATMTGLLAEVRAQTEGAEPPPEETLRSVLDTKRQELDATEISGKTMLTQQASAATQSLSQNGTQQSAAITQIGTSTAASIDQVVAQSQQSLTATTTAVAQTRQRVGDGFTQAANQIATEHGTADDTAINGLRTDTNTALANVRSRLAQYPADLTGDFTRTLGGMDAKITSEADAAAAKVQPAWKSFVSILVKIIVAIVVAVAIAALFASGAGVLALLVGGALIGAAGAAVTYLTDCALGLKEFSAREFVAEVVAGAIGGAIGALTAGTGGAIGGMVAQGIKNTVAQTVVNIAVSTAVSFVSNSIVTGMQQVAKNVIMGKPMFENVWRSVVENAGMNLIGAFAGSLAAGARAPQGQNALGLPTGGYGVREMFTGGNMRTMGTNMTARFDTSTGLSTGPLGTGGMAGTAGVTAVGAAGNAATMPTDMNNVSTNQGDIASANAETVTRTRGTVGTELADQQATHNTPAPSAPWTFNPQRP